MQGQKTPLLCTTRAHDRESLLFLDRWWQPKLAVEFSLVATRKPTEQILHECLARSLPIAHIGGCLPDHDAALQHQQQPAVTRHRGRSPARQCLDGHIANHCGPLQGAQHRFGTNGRHDVRHNHLDPRSRKHRVQDRRQDRDDREHHQQLNYGKPSSILHAEPLSPR